MMDRIIDRVEQDHVLARAVRDRGAPRPSRRWPTPSQMPARQISKTIGARAIAAYTMSGSTALRIARTRPDCPVLGLTTDQMTARRMAVVWGVHAVVTAETHTMTETVSRASRIARTEGFAAHGDSVVVAAGVPFGQAGTTNALRVTSVR